MCATLLRTGSDARAVPARPARRRRRAVLACPARAGTGPRVVVVGGGFAGATAARALARGRLAVTLVERDRHYVACPFSNVVDRGPAGDRGAGLRLRRRSAGDGADAAARHRERGAIDARRAG